MATEGWVSVGECESETAADTQAAALSVAGVPNELIRDQAAGIARSPGSWIWVPPEWVERARAILDEQAVPESELAAQALSYPEPEHELAEQSGPFVVDRRPLLLTILAVAAAVLGVRMMLGEVATRSEEIAVSPSPDGRTDAALLEIQKDAHGAHALRVCLRVHAQRAVPLARCADVAYLSGVPRAGEQHGVQLVWVDSTRLEIRYAAADAATLYMPVYTGSHISSRRLNAYSANRNFDPIHIELIHLSTAPGAQ